MEFVPVEHMDEVLMHALVWNENHEGDEDELFRKLEEITEAHSKSHSVPMPH